MDITEKTLDAADIKQHLQHIDRKLWPAVREKTIQTFKAYSKEDLYLFIKYSQGSTERDIKIAELKYFEDFNYSEIGSRFNIPAHHAKISLEKSKNRIINIVVQSVIAAIKENGEF